MAVGTTAGWPGGGPGESDAAAVSELSEDTGPCASKAGPGYDRPRSKRRERRGLPMTSHDYAAIVMAGNSIPRRRRWPPEARGHARPRATRLLPHHQTAWNRRHQLTVKWNVHPLTLQRTPPRKKACRGFPLPGFHAYSASSAMVLDVSAVGQQRERGHGIHDVVKPPSRPRIAPQAEGCAAANVRRAPAPGPPPGRRRPSESW